MTAVRIFLILAVALAAGCMQRVRDVPPLASNDVTVGAASPVEPEPAKEAAATAVSAPATSEPPQPAMTAGTAAEIEPIVEAEPAAEAEPVAAAPPVAELEPVVVAPVSAEAPAADVSPVEAAVASETPAEAPPEVPAEVPVVAAIADPVQEAVAPTAEPTLDVAALKARLKETDAIGMFTKLSLKNQVDDLLAQFRKHYLNGQTTDVAELRQAYDMLVLKVLVLLQDSDPPLARTISGSREAIWGILADPVKFNKVT